ncbi:hypothetical protein DM794_04360 [Paenarthrobacter ureafaciens]|uniref:hypothetical protein n=1 Tax=Paenarthrobacter ureafaciens TaxID=37931 RepID=UPI0015BAC90A|nr:hypothetical protein [Paenarthrobacter ureafaciens]MEC3854122.1 hypothetical protein [Paenarthrobacter ureafaciens]NWL26299.1 hypothetical protein [Paenarthrobacter ureafaciens]
MDLHLQTDWQRAVGQRVEIWKAGKLSRSGTVEAAMPDNSILWLSAEGAATREMIHEADGWQVFAHFKAGPGAQ